MSTPVAILLFVTSLAATLAAAALFAGRLDRLGSRLGIHEAVLGLLTALAADAPELSSGITAMVRGERGVGIGVLLGSNVFNIAAMVGVSALLSGGVALARPALALEGAFALFAIAVSGGVLYAGLPSWTAVALLVVWTVPYLVLLARGTFHGPLPPKPRELTAPIQWPGARAAAGRSAQVLALFVRELPALAVIVVGSVGMVDSAVTLAERYGMPKMLVGLLVLATATSLPNAFTAIRLGLAGRGAALVSETLNSNTINLAAGIVIASAVVTIAHGGFVLDYLWMLAETVAMLVLVARRGGAGRAAGGLLIGSYIAYVAVRVVATG
jgi:cation:H+ antiporter